MPGGRVVEGMQNPGDLNIPDGVVLRKGPTVLVVPRLLEDARFESVAELGGSEASADAEAAELAATTRP